MIKDDLYRRLSYLSNSTWRKTTVKISSYSSSGHRLVSSINNSHKRKREEEGVFSGRMELDSHADTIVAGANFCVLHYTGRECDVSPYDTSYQPVRNVPIVCAATAWQSPKTGQVYILVFNECLYMPSLPHSLINPNQL